MTDYSFEYKHPRAPAGSSSGGQFVRKYSAGAASPQGESRGLPAYLEKLWDIGARYADVGLIADAYYDVEEELNMPADDPVVTSILWLGVRGIPMMRAVGWRYESAPESEPVHPYDDRVAHGVSMMEVAFDDGRVISSRKASLGGPGRKASGNIKWYAGVFIGFSADGEPMITAHKKIRPPI